ncbi:hypothetical protein K437DRAFT_270543 [Tilletiaria anomala UBC 951]|uniref:Uncharacterized protein n=1 Tax=Tilletiaria anomala (strain ATCC 24038 / CBS 436.72 / UBC 951) TaxID=1037660 RepID=A0A066V9U3_TILAU|nr:uncharacterized protein K437DRAFT_270543 [Tilletiaria anomala UBC 951]KDN38512.1 hypothetical protein K437DRAFT_270543 [Tilletiaria anomala UBC 951]
MVLASAADTFSASHALISASSAFVMSSAVISGSAAQPGPFSVPRASQQSLWQRRLDSRGPSSPSIEPASVMSSPSVGSGPVDGMFVFPSLTEALHNRKQMKRRPPSSLKLVDRSSSTTFALGPATAAPAFSGRPNLNPVGLLNLEQTFHSLPNTPTSLLPPSSGPGFPSPFSVPHALPPSPASISKQFAEQVPHSSSSPPEKSPQFSPTFSRSSTFASSVMSRPAPKQDINHHAAQVATEVALSALDLEDLTDGFEKELQIVDAQLRLPIPSSRRRSVPVGDKNNMLVWDPMAERRASADHALSEDLMPSSEPADGSLGETDEAPRRKGRARMSQEKRRRLARRREREAASALQASASAGVPLHQAYDYVVPRSAPPYVTTFDSRMGTVDEPKPRSPSMPWSPTTVWAPPCTSSASQKHFSGERPMQARPSMDSFRAMHFNNASSPSLAHAPTPEAFSQSPLDFDWAYSSPAPSLSPSGSSVSSPFDKAFEHASVTGHGAQQRHLPQHNSASTLRALDLDASYSSASAWTPAPPPRVRVVIQPPTPQDAAAVAGKLGSLAATASGESDIRSAKRLSQILSPSPEPIAEHEESFFAARAMSDRLRPSLY